MNKALSISPASASKITLAVAAALISLPVQADSVTDWNEYAIKATKGFEGTTGSGVALNSNLASRIEAIAARAVFDAVNSIDHFSDGYHYYRNNNTGSAAAAQTAHDVLLNPAATGSTADPKWTQTCATATGRVGSAKLDPAGTRRRRGGSSPSSDLERWTP